jgi:hypothetical protein
MTERKMEEILEELEKQYQAASSMFPASEGHLLQCKCGRQVLVEIILVGVSHNVKVIITCWECLSQEAQQRAFDLYGLKEIQGRDNS